MKIRIRLDQRFIRLLFASALVALSLSLALYGSRTTAASAPPAATQDDFPDNILLFPDSANPPVLVWHPEDSSKRQTIVRFNVTNPRLIKQGNVALEIFGLDDPYHYFPPIKVIARIQPFPASGIVMEWDGTDDAGIQVEEGLYPYNIKAFVLAAIPVPEGGTPPLCGKSDQKNSPWLEIGPPTDDDGIPVSEMVYAGLDDNSTPEDDKDDSRIYHIRYGLKEPERNASSGMVRLYDPDYEIVWERSITAMPSAIEGDTSTGLEASPVGRQHKREARVPVSVMEKTGVYRFVVFAQDSRADQNCGNISKPAQEKGGKAQPVVKDIAAGYFHSLFLLSDGTVFACGQNDTGQLGIGNKNDQTTPQLVQFPKGVVVVEMAAGFSHSLALTKDKEVYAWGSNTSGQLGIGNNEQGRPKPDQDKPVKIPNFDKVVAIAAGGVHSMAVKGATDKELYTWGANFSGNAPSGQLGLGDFTIVLKTSPTSTGFKGVTAIAAGSFYSLALKDEKVYAWGNNDEGQLGLNDKDKRNKPTVIPDFGPAVNIAAGGIHSLAIIKKTGETTRVWVWGSNGEGQLGHGNIGPGTDRLKPEMIQDIGPLVAVSAGTVHSVALRSDNKVYVWGSGPYLGLGDGNNRIIAKPVENSNLSKIKKVSTGYAHTLALDEAGKVFAFGFNGNGQLGLGDKKDRSKPEEVKKFDRSF